MKSFDNRAHKIQCNNIFYIKTYYLFDLGLRQPFFTLFDYFLQGRLAKISDKSCSKRDLVSDVVVIFIHYKMLNLDSITNKNNKIHNKKWLSIPDHSYKILIIGGSGSGKTDALFNLINEQNDINKSYLYARDLSEPKYEYLIKTRENAGIKHINNSNTFIECSNTMDDVYENIHDYNPNRIRKILIVFDDMIADIMTNKKFQAIIKELFIRCRKLNISLVFITQSYFSVPKDVRLNSTHYLIMKINNKRELQNIVINHSADIDYQDFIKIYRECTKEPFNVLTIDTTLSASNLLRFRKNLFETL